jgi:beta-1,4-mannosyl-glycoprotein beta-1,4-N-acetylglucosaminyltransferase
MLECRLKFLYPYVDYFVISECNYTHSGKRKELNYLKNLNRFKNYSDKIIYLPYIVSDQDYQKWNFNQREILDLSSDFWNLERAQRNFILNGIEHFSDNDIVFITDLDEIINPFNFTEIINRVQQQGNCALIQRMFYYNLSVESEIRWASCGVATKKEMFRLGPNYVRSSSYSDPTKVIWDGGWHMSYFMNPEQIKNKLENFAHQEYNEAHWKDLNRIQDCIKDGKDLFNRDIKWIKSEKNSFPEEFLNVFSQWYPA